MVFTGMDYLAGERANGGVSIIVEDPLRTLVTFSYKLIFEL
jgi:hypothetical protein